MRLIEILHKIRMENIQQPNQSVGLEENEKIKMRREARRRKILENAKSRLEKLNMKQSGDGDGVEDSGASKPREDCEYPDPEVEADAILTDFHSSNIESNVAELFANSLNTNVKSIENKNVLFKRKIHVLLAVIISYVGTLVSWENRDMFSLSVFVPAALLIALEFMFYREQRQGSFLTGILVLLGFQSQNALKLLTLFSIVQDMISNIGIFVFFFCIATFTLTGFSNKFVICTVK